MHDVNDWFTRHFGGLQTESSHQSLHANIACVSYELAEGQDLGGFAAGGTEAVALAPHCQSASSPH